MPSKRKPSKQAKAKAITPADRAISANLVAVLTEKGKTRQWLADALGLHEGSIDKYCMGTARISASRLWDVSRLLDVPILRFFQGFGPL